MITSVNDCEAVLETSSMDSDSGMAFSLNNRCFGRSFSGLLACTVHIGLNVALSQIRIDHLEVRYFTMLKTYMAGYATSFLVYLKTLYQVNIFSLFSAVTP